MNKICLFLLAILLTTKGFSQTTSVITVAKGAETVTNIDIVFTLNISSPITFYSCNFQILFSGLSNSPLPTQVSVVSPSANYTTNVTTGSGGISLNSSVDVPANAISVGPVSWTVNFTKGSGSTPCFTMGSLNECLNTNFDDYPATLPDGCNIVLHAEMLNFQAQNTAKGNLLTWQTDSEKGNFGFNVERSADGKTFENIGFVKGFGTTNQKQSYQFTDNGPLSISYYRLQQEDVNGAKTYSKTVTVALPKAAKIALKPYPNPTHNVISIEPFVDFKTLKIYNLQGVLLLKSNKTEADVSAFIAGTYLLEVENTEGGLARVKFIKE